MIRILVDGYSLLHGWPSLAPGAARHSATAREELIVVLQQYQDAVGTPITIVFDGQGPSPQSDADLPSTPQLEVLYSKSGQTADDIIERVGHRLRQYGDFLVVTDDYAERDTIITLGGMTSSCENFIRTVESTLKGLEREVTLHNQRERRKFNNALVK